MGRPLITTAEKELKGSYNVTRENPDQPRMPVEVPVPPLTLMTTALPYWNKMCQCLEEMRCISKVDIFIIQQFAEAWVLREQYLGKMMTEGLVQVTTNNRTGNVMMRKSPWAELFYMNEKHIVTLLSQMGMTPTTRSKLIAKFNEEERGTSDDDADTLYG
jgi:P27 family predicted phage terminase small subunit